MTTLRYTKSTHAPLYKRFVSREKGFVEIGEEGMYGPIDPETGAEYKGLGGNDHRYNRDYKVGSSYPLCGFLFATDGESISLDHDELEAYLKKHDLWADCLERVIVPSGTVHGQITWDYGFQFTPVERSPRVERMTERLKRLAESPELVYSTPHSVEANL